VSIREVTSKGLVKSKRKRKFEKAREHINNGGSAVEKILNSKKIKYKVLDELLEYELPKNIDTVNMFIDIYSVINTLYSPQVIEESLPTLNEHEKFMITSELVNLVAHYRHYFISRKGLYTNFIFYYSDERSEFHMNINDEYKKKFYSKRVDDTVKFKTINKLLQTNITLMKPIIDNIPHAYLINTKHIDYNVVPHYMMQFQSKDEYSLIYSNDKLSLLNVIHNPNDCMVMTARSDKSKLYDSTNAIKRFSKAKSIDSINLLPDFLPFILAISGYKKYSLSGIRGYGIIKSSRLIEKAIKKDFLSNIPYDIDNFIEGIRKLDKLSDEDLEVVRNNYLLIDVDNYIQYFDEADEELFNSAFVDKGDYKGLREINDKYFTHFPLQLDEIMEGEG